MKYIPEEPYLYVSLAMNQIKLSHYDQAISYLKKGLDYDEKNVLLHFNLADVYDKIDNKEAAISELKTCLGLNPDDPEISNYLAYLYSELGINLQEALKLIKISLYDDIDNFAYLDTAGWINYKLENFEKSKYYLEKAKTHMEISKDYDSSVYEHLIAVYSKLNNLEMVNLYKKDLAKLNKQSK